MSDRSVRVEPGFRGVVTGVTRTTAWEQRVTLTLRDSSGRAIASTTLLGKGEDIPMFLEINPNMKGWSFGPFNQTAIVDVSVEYLKDGVWCPAQSIRPITVRKDPDPQSPQTYMTSTYTVEASGDSSQYNDCIINIFQYK